MATTIDRVNILIKQGATFRWRIFIKDSLNVPVDLTGCHAVMQIRRSPKAELALAEVSTFNNGILIDGPLGQIDVHIPHTTTAQLALEEASYDMLLLWPNGDVSRIREGGVRIALGTSREWQTS